MKTRIVIQNEPFDLAREVDALSPGAGAVATFTGHVRAGDGLTSLALEHYPGMTERSIGRIVDEARTRWKIIDALVIHRVGELKAADQIVLVVVTGSHRQDAFAACEFIMDYLKTQAPFWKKEQTPQGARWVEARAADDQAVERWSQSQPK